MAIIYKVKQASKANKEGKKLYHPSTVHIGLVTTAQMAKEVAEYSSLTAGDVKNTIDNLITVVARHLQASESVTLNGFGSFRYTLNKVANGVENAEDVSITQSKLMVRFIPASTRNANRTTATRSLVTGARCVRFDQVPATPETGTETGTGENPDDEGEEGTYG